MLLLLILTQGAIMEIYGRLLKARIYMEIAHKERYSRNRHQILCSRTPGLRQLKMPGGRPSVEACVFLHLFRRARP